MRSHMCARRMRAHMREYAITLPTLPNSPELVFKSFIDQRFCVGRAFLATLPNPPGPSRGFRLGELSLGEPILLAKRRR